MVLTQRKQYVIYVPGCGYYVGGFRDPDRAARCEWTDGENPTEDVIRYDSTERAISAIRNKNHRFDYYLGVDVRLLREEVVLTAAEVL